MKTASFGFILFCLLLSITPAESASSQRGRVSGKVPGTVAELPLPLSKETFLYSAVEYPAESLVPSDTRPVGVGPVAEGGGSLNLQVGIGPFESPVDMYLTLLTPDDSHGPVYLMNAENRFEPFSQVMKPWKKGVKSAHELVADLPAMSLATGPYVLMFVVSPADSLESYYLWTVPFTVQ